MNSSDLRGTTQELYKTIAAQKDFPTCIHCENFDDATEVCKLAGARPPARVIAQGCESFDTRIPF